MADLAPLVFGRQRALDHTGRPHVLQRGRPRHGARASCRIPLGRCSTHRSPVHQDVVEEVAARVLPDHAQVIVEREIVRLSRFGHQVRDIDANGVHPGDRPRDPLHQQAWQDACVETARPDHDGIRIDEGAEHVGEGPGARRERQAADGPAVTRDRGFADEDRPVGHLRAQADVLTRGRQHPPPKPQDLAEPIDGDGEVACHLRQGSQEQVAERVPLEPISRSKPVLQDVAKRRIEAGDRHEAIPDVAGRQNAALFSQTTGTSAVIGDGHDRGQRVRSHERAGVIPRAQPLEDDGQPGASADGHDARASWLSRCCTGGASGARASRRGSAARLDCTTGISQRVCHAIRAGFPPMRTGAQEEVSGFGALKSRRSVRSVSVTALFSISTRPVAVCWTGCGVNPSSK